MSLRGRSNHAWRGEKKGGYQGNTRKAAAWERKARAREGAELAPDSLAERE